MGFLLCVLCVLCGCFLQIYAPHRATIQNRKFRVCVQLKNLEICSKNMMDNFQIKSLQYTEFCELFKLDDHELEKTGAVRMIVDRKPGFPCRVSLRDAEIG